MNEIRSTLYQKIEGMFDKKNETKEIKEISYDKNEKILTEKIGIYEKLSEELKQSYADNFIYNENSFLNMTNNYIKSFSNLQFYVDNELKYCKDKTKNIDKNIKKIYIKNHDYSIKAQSILVT